jgi:hypothetical protein
MPITTTNSEYDKRVRQWQRCQDAIDGSDAIKARGEVYLPVRSCARSLRWKRRRCWRNI